MALTERQEQKLEILPNGVIQVQDISIIERDGVETRVRDQGGRARAAGGGCDHHGRDLAGTG